MPARSCGRSDPHQDRDDSFGRGIGTMREIRSGFPDDFRGILHVSAGAIHLHLGAVEPRMDLAADPFQMVPTPEADHAASSCGRGDT
jgi:hypothetical protein